MEQHVADFLASLSIQQIENLLELKKKEKNKTKEEIKKELNKLEQDIQKKDFIISSDINFLPEKVYEITQGKYAVYIIPKFSNLTFDTDSKVTLKIWEDRKYSFLFEEEILERFPWINTLFPHWKKWFGVGSTCYFPPKDCKKVYHTHEHGIYNLEYMLLFIEYSQIMYKKDPKI